MNKYLNEKSLNDQKINKKMTSHEERCVKTLLFDSIPIENYIFALLHAEVGVRNKIVYIFLIGLVNEWILFQMENFQ